jgi:hypothetical protein
MCNFGTRVSSGRVVECLRKFFSFSRTKTKFFWGDADVRIRGASVRVFCCVLYTDVTQKQECTLLTSASFLFLLFHIIIFGRAGINLYFYFFAGRGSIETRKLPNPC